MYGKVGLSVSENNKTNPISNYGKTKLKCEKIIKKFYTNGHLKNCIILRFFNVAGSDYNNGLGQIKKNGQLIKNLCLAPKMKQKNFYINGKDYNTKDGTCIRDYIHVVDLAKAHVTAMQRLIEKNNKDNYEVFNIGTGKGTSVLEIVKTFEKISSVKLNYSFEERRTGDIISAYADTTRANKVLGWKSELTIEDAIHSAWEWEKKIRSKINK